MEWLWPEAGRGQMGSRWSRDTELRVCRWMSPDYCGSAPKLLPHGPFHKGKHLLRFLAPALFSRWNLIHRAQRPTQDMETTEGRLPPLLKASGCAEMLVGKFTSKCLYHRVLGHTHTHTHTHIHTELEGFQNKITSRKRNPLVCLNITAHTTEHF